MTGDPSPETRAELQDALDTLLCNAFENGVEVNDHAYTLRHDDPDIPDWEVLVTGVSNQ